MNRRERPPMASINITPLVDVMLVLLIVFLVTASLGQEAIPVDLPSARSQAVVQPGPVVTIDRDLRVFVDDQAVSETTLTEALKASLASRPAKSVTLRADRTVPYGELIRVVEKVRASGAEKLDLFTAPEDEYDVPEVR